MVSSTTSVATAGSDVWTIGRLLEWTTTFFAARELESPRLEAEILLAEVLSARRIDLYLMYDVEVAPGDRARFREQIRKRADGCPTAYLVGRKEFLSLEFEVDRSVLIPRPETEILVEEALAWGQRNQPITFVDVGTGSGAIAVSLLVKMPQSTGLAVDVSEAALAIARRNAARHGVRDRLEFVQSDLFSAVSPRSCDLIVANPPYIPSADIGSLARSVKEFEPKLALDGGGDGLDVLRRLLPDSASYLRSGGRLLVEIGFNQAPAVLDILAAVPDLKLCQVRNDYNRIPRVLIAERA